MSIRSIATASTTILCWLCCVIAGCSATPTPQAPGEPTERDVLDVWNERARLGATSDVLHGVTVDDPYRALEEDSEATQAWIKGQTRRTEWALSKAAMPGAKQRLRELLSIGTIEQPSLGGDSVFFLRREGDRERSALYRRAADGVETLLIAPETYGERAAIDWFFPSPDGRHVAFGVSDNGDERSTLRVVRVSDRVVLNESIERAKWSSVSWLNDGSGFYYTRYPAPGEQHYDEANPESYFPRLCFHQLDSDVAFDPMVWSGPKPTDFPALTISDDDRYLLVHNFRSWTWSDVYLLDRGADPTERVIAPDAAHPLRELTDRWREALTNGRVHRGSIYLHTNLDAPRGHILRVQPDQLDLPGRRRTVVPESDATIEDWALTDDTIAVHRIENVQSRLDLYSMVPPKPVSTEAGTGGPPHSIPLPTIGTIDALNGDPHSDRLVFTFSSFLLPPTLYALSDAATEATPIVRVTSKFDASRYALSREQVTSADGTSINVYLVHDAHLIRDGNNPVLLYGYGGFNVPALPSFTPNALYLLERGCVFAVANIRGGSEFGEQWHRAGMLANKHHAFEDFEAVIQWLSDEKLSRPGRIAIAGGSNGGLLMGAMLTRVPEKFGAVISRVGLYDMVRYPKFPPAALWVSEYGDPDRAEDFAYLHAYSPYHQVHDGASYPFTLIETADHDTRVHWAHSTKFAARLQQAASDPTRIYFYMEQDLGHGRGVSLNDQVRRQLRKLAFLTRALGM